MKTWITAQFVLLAIFVTAIFAIFSAPAVAADSIYGKVTSVKSAEVVVINYGTGTYDIRIAGIDAPTGKERGAEEARKFVASAAYCFRRTHACGSNGGRRPAR